MVRAHQREGAEWRGNWWTCPKPGYVMTTVPHGAGNENLCRDTNRFVRFGMVLAHWWYKVDDGLPSLD